jgi:hypothetical protein
MSTDHLLDSRPNDLLNLSNSDEMMLWTDEKRKEFVVMFHQRVKVARAILLWSAHLILDRAHTRQFIGPRHFNLLGYHPHCSFPTHELYDDRRESAVYGNPPRGIGGRPQEEIFEIAQQRAEEILSNLPPIKEAVRIIDPETANMIDKKEKLKKKGEELNIKLEEASVPIIMSELNPKMQIGDFLALVKEKDTHRRKLLDKLDEIGREGSELEIAISKRLFKGLPGLAEAVIDVVKNHQDRAKALDAMGRRVEEQVRFGDSDAAKDLLKHFEKDEAQISQNVKNQFAAALEKLKLLGKKKRLTAKAGS